MCKLFNSDRDGDELHGDGVGMNFMGMAWGWGNSVGMGLISTTMSLFNMCLGLPQRHL